MKNYTLENLKDILRQRLQDEEFDGDVLTTFLNQAQSEILGEDKYPFMERIDEYDACCEDMLDLPMGYAGTFHIFMRKKNYPDTPLTYISPEEYFEAPHKQMTWTKFAKRIFYTTYKSDPANASQCEGYKITHLYLENPRPLEKDTDTSPIPPQYIEALILGALARAEQLRDNFDYAQIYQNQQDQILTNMKLRYGPGNLSANNRAKLPFFGGNRDDRN